MDPLQGKPGAAAEGRLAAECSAPNKLEAKVDVLMLLRLRDQLKQQLLEYSAMVQTGQESCPDHITEEKLIKSATKDLENDLEEVKVSLENKRLALQRIQVMVALRNKMKQNDNDSRLIVETTKQIVTLSKTIIDYQQQVREKEQKLIDIKRKRLSLKKAGAQKLLQIHTMMKKQKEEQAGMEASRKLKKICDNFQKQRHITTIIQNVFQSIIIGSRVNWAEDPYLKAIVLQLEKNLCFL